MRVSCLALGLGVGSERNWDRGYLQGEGGGIGVSWANWYGLLKHNCCKRFVEVETIVETLHNVVFREISAIAGKESMIC